MFFDPVSRDSLSDIMALVDGNTSSDWEIAEVDENWEWGQFIACHQWRKCWKGHIGKVQHHLPIFLAVTRTQNVSFKYIHKGVQGEEVLYRHYVQAPGFPAYVIRPVASNVVLSLLPSTPPLLSLQWAFTGAPCLTLEWTQEGSPNYAQARRWNSSGF